MTTDRAVRAGRAAVFAAVCVLLAAVGHIAMSGTPLPWWVLGGAFGVTGAAVWPLTGRERGRTAVTAAAVLVQTALHTGFSWAQAVTTAPPGASAKSPSFAQQWASYLLCGEAGGTLPEGRSVRLVTRAGLGDRLQGPPPGGHGTGTGTGTGTGHASGGHAMSDMANGAMHHDMTSIPGMTGMSSSGMLAAHLLAALLAGLWLAHGERAVFRVGRAFASQLLAPLRWFTGCPVVPAVGPLRPIRRDHEVARPRRLLLVHVITSRGPPHGTAVV